MRAQYVRAAVVIGLLFYPVLYAGAQSITNDAPCGIGTSLTVPAAADSAARRPSSRPDTTKSAAVILFAAASAREITFAKQPEIRVRLCGGLDSIHVVERRNLPNPVVTGHTYRDVYVAVEIFGRLNADCIVAALTSTAAPRDSSGQRNACASLDVSGTRSRPPAIECLVSPTSYESDSDS